MTEEPIPPARRSDDDPLRDRLVPSPARALIQGLETLRARVRQRLDQIETLARERADAPTEAHSLSEREQTLQRHVTELEDAKRRLRIETDRWEKERQTAAEQLEHDRRLLAEAWERLEREQVEGPAAPPAQSPRADRPAPTVARAAVPADYNDPVTQAILKQFQALRRDVRRNANGPCSG